MQPKIMAPSAVACRSPPLGQKALETLWARVTVKERLLRSELLAGDVCEVVSGFD